MSERINDHATTAAGLVIAGAIGSDINIDRLMARDKQEVAKAIIVIGTALWGFFTNRQKQRQEAKQQATAKTQQN